MRSRWPPRKSKPGQPADCEQVQGGMQVEEGIMSTMTMHAQPWYRSLNANQWKTMVASNIGWMFDGYETYAWILTVGVALRQLLEPSQYGELRIYAGTVIGITLLGWGVGGFIGGILAD